MITPGMTPKQIENTLKFRYPDLLTVERCESGHFNAVFALPAAQTPAEREERAVAAGLVCRLHATSMQLMFGLTIHDYGYWLLVGANDCVPVVNFSIDF